MAIHIYIIFTLIFENLFFFLTISRQSPSPRVTSGAHAPAGNNLRQIRMKQKGKKKQDSPQGTELSVASTSRGKRRNSRTAEMNTYGYWTYTLTKSPEHSLMAIDDRFQSLDSKYVCALSAKKKKLNNNKKKLKKIK